MAAMYNGELRANYRFILGADRYRMIREDFEHYIAKWTMRRSVDGVQDVAIVPTSQCQSVLRFEPIEVVIESIKI